MKAISLSRSSVTLMLYTPEVRPSFMQTACAKSLLPRLPERKLTLICCATDGLWTLLQAAAKARSARVKITPPMMPPWAFLCPSVKVTEALAQSSPISSRVMPFYVAKRSFMKNCFASSRFLNVLITSRSFPENMYGLYHFIDINAKKRLPQGSLFIFRFSFL